MHDELRDRMRSKATDDLRAILDAPADQYTDDAREAAREELMTRVDEEPETPIVPPSSTSGSTFAKVISVIGILALFRSLIRLIAHYVQ